MSGGMSGSQWKSSEATGTGVRGLKSSEEDSRTVEGPKEQWTG